MYADSSNSIRDKIKQLETIICMSGISNDLKDQYESKIDVLEAEIELYNFFNLK